MFVIPTNVGFTYRAVAMLVAFAVALVTFGIHHTTAQAANLTEVSNTLTDSAPAVLSGHDIRFTIPASSSLPVTGTTTITFPSGFTGVGTLVTGDLTVTVNGTPDPHTGFATSGQSISFSGVTAAAADDVRIVIASTKVTNPSVGSYEFYITTGTDTGRTRVAIVNTVEVTAQVNTSFDFQIYGLSTTTAINGTTTTGSSSPDALPFGVLTAWQIKTLAQQLTVTTNARNGFVVTVEQDSSLQSANGADIDSFFHDTYVNTPTAWVAPSSTLLQENTYGHWGLTSNDSDLNAGEFTSGGGNKWVAASTTPRTIFSHNGPSDGTTQDYGQAEIGYQVQIGPLQEAGDDYNTTLTYIATPTF